MLIVFCWFLLVFFWFWHILLNFVEFWCILLYFIGFCCILLELCWDLVFIVFLLVLVYLVAFCWFLVYFNWILLDFAVFYYILLFLLCFVICLYFVVFNVFWFVVFWQSLSWLDYLRILGVFAGFRFECFYFKFMDFVFDFLRWFWVFWCTLILFVCFNFGCFVGIVEFGVGIRREIGGFDVLELSSLVVYCLCVLCLIIVFWVMKFG